MEEETRERNNKKRSFEERKEDSSNNNNDSSSSSSNKNNAEEEPEKWVSAKQKREQLIQSINNSNHRNRNGDRRGGFNEEEEEKRRREEEEEEEEKKPKKSLLEQRVDLVKRGELQQLTEKQQKVKEEETLLQSIQDDFKPLQAVTERAKGIEYTESLRTSWKPPFHVRNMSLKHVESLRKKLHILVDGEDVVPPILSFEDMKLPREMIDCLREMGIRRPTPIQIQGLPVALSGRDMIGIAYTGSGKTMVFSAPMFLFALEEEKKLPIISGEGPFGLILCPSRELARQTFDLVEKFSDAFARSGQPRLKSMLAIGGLSIRDQEKELRSGIHMVVATPGRLLDMLNKKKINLDLCKYFVLDEADRLVDLGFEDEIRNIIDFFSGQRQTVLFSATMPKKIQNFARSALVRPIEVNVGRAGAANLDVFQEVEYVKQENKVAYLLECLQKTPPPVLIFCENKNDVDDIYEYLLIKGVEVVSVHGGKDQEEREYAIKSFKDRTKDVLVATDVASKGLDFPNIQHVINYDMPKEIENYVHRIGRTGRRGMTGVATTFVNKNDQETTLLDLKHLLIESKQKLPVFLQTLESPDVPEEMGNQPCGFCGGLGHLMSDCPKRTKAARKANSHGGGDGGY
eukprot:TRINITY_DN195_c0_g3_i4.p1 TRINITY_DN195_c0_g3~~TRINITY_DN195_c0_g3_i4.p1  ORF type:complete len:629 (+),score=253.58 TRINITY_DN195_c0_g3_i4:55-1941(+)